MSSGWCREGIVMRRPRKIRQDPIRRKLNYWVNWFSDAQYEQYREREEDEEDGLLRIVDEAELEALKRLGYDTTYVVLSDKSRLEILLRELWAKRPSPIKEVADQLGLEPDDPGDQETLLLVLADIVCAKEEPRRVEAPDAARARLNGARRSFAFSAFGTTSPNADIRR